MQEPETTAKLEALEDRLRTIERKLDVLWGDIASVAMFFLGLAAGFKFGLSFSVSFLIACGLGVMSLMSSKYKLRYKQ